MKVGGRREEIRNVLKKSKIEEKKIEMVKEKESTKKKEYRLKKQIINISALISI